VDSQAHHQWVQKLSVFRIIETISGQRAGHLKASLNWCVYSSVSRGQMYVASKIAEPALPHPNRPTMKRRLQWRKGEPCAFIKHFLKELQSVNSTASWPEKMSWGPLVLDTSTWLIIDPTLQPLSV